MKIKYKLVFKPSPPTSLPKQDPAILKARHTLRNKQHRENAKVGGILLRTRTAIHKHRNRHLFRAHRLLSSVNKQQQQTNTTTV